MANSSSESCMDEASESENAILEVNTPTKLKRRYKRSIHHGVSKKSARYHKVDLDLPVVENIIVANPSPSYREEEERNYSTNETDESHKTPSEDGSNTDVLFTSSIESAEEETSGNNTDIDGTLTDTVTDGTSASFITSSSDEDANAYEYDNEFYSEFDDEENNEDINEPLFKGCKLSKKGSYTMIMLFALRYKLPKAGFSHLLKLVEAHLPEKCNYSTSVYSVKDTLKRIVKFKEPTVHKFCEKCQRLLLNNENCVNEVCNREQASILEFYDLNMSDQLQSLFQDQNFIDAIQRQQDKLSLANEGLTDIAQGQRYKKITRQHNNADINLTFTINTDGVSLFKSSKKGSLWPVYIAINELPIKLRFTRKYLIPCYLFCQIEKPNMLTYLTPMMETLKTLHETGQQVITPTGLRLLVKAQVIAVSLDLPAKAIVSNMKQFNGRFGCSVCLDEGESPPGRPMLRFYPYQELSLERTHQSMMRDAREAVTLNYAVQGVKGVSALMILDYIDLPKCLVIDWMHCVLLGVTKAMLKHWFDGKKKDESFFIGDKIDLLNKRYLKIKIPAFVARRQRSLHDHAHWKASEYREWLIHFSAPVLYGVMDCTVYTHYLLLVTAMSILTKDDLTIEKVNAAEKLLTEFCKMYPIIYGEQTQSMNVHLLKHLADFVKMYGPLFGYSCFGFESMNSYLKNMVHGTRHINKQVSFAVGMSKQLGSLVKEVTDGNVSIRQLTLELSSKLILDERLSEESGSALGKKRTVENTCEYYHLLSQDMRQKNPKSFTRLKVSDQIYYSKNYQNAKTRNDCVVCFSIKDEDKHGVILSFIETDNNKYVIIQEYLVDSFKLSDNMKQSVQFRELNDYSEDLCPHIVKVITCGEKLIVPFNCLGKKCVFVEVDANNIFISCPPNLLEHN